MWVTPNLNRMKRLNVPHVHVFGIPVARLTMSETLHQVDLAIAKRRQIHHSVVNAGKIVSMNRNPELRESVLGANLINADGMAVVWASRLLRRPLPERVTGCDLMEKLVDRAAARGYKVFFLGAKPEVLDATVDTLVKKHDPAILAGKHHGYFTPEEAPTIARMIAASEANILFVAMTSPLKEIFLDTYKRELSNVNMIMGVGGSFDVVAGKVQRAPLWMQDAGLEWFYRFIQEPKRMWKRYLVGNARFMALTMREMFKPTPALA